MAMDCNRELDVTKQRTLLPGADTMERPSCVLWCWLVIRGDGVTALEHCHCPVLGGGTLNRLNR